MSKESGGAPGGGGNHNGGVNGGGANSGSSKGGGNGGGKGSGKNDSRGSSGPTSLGGASSYGMSSGSFNNSIGANNKGQQATSGNGKNDNRSVATRIASVSKTLSSYKATSTPAYARPGYGDTIKAQRQQLAGPGSGAGPSSIGGPSMYGMEQDTYDKTINTDNYNGVIGSIQQKLQRGTLSEADRGSLSKATQDYNGIRGAGVVGSTLAGTPGKWSAQKLAGTVMGEPGDYLSGMTRKAASGQLDDSRLAGQRDKLGDGGGLDSTLKGALSLVGMIAPGAGMVTSAIGSGLTVGAPGHGSLLNSLNEQAGNTVNQSGGNGNSSNRDYGAPPRPGVAPSTEQARDEGYQAFRYDPTQYRFNQGQRATEEWRY